MGQRTTAQALRAQLMAPQAIERVHALHALELELGDAPTNPVATELEAFTARGIPYYAPDSPDYREWVAKAVGYWEQLHAADTHAPVPRMTAHNARAVKRQKQAS